MRHGTATAWLTAVALTMATGQGEALARTLSTQEMLQRMMSGGPMLDEEDLRKAMAKAAPHPLGSDKNPVRAAMPAGEIAYLSRLRCADGRAPAFGRVGNLGPGVYSSIVDDFEIDCGNAAPGKVHVVMDMYFSGYVEERPVPGFTIVPSRAPAGESAGAS